MSLLADKDVTMTSVNGTLRIAAAKELIVECGGAFIQLKDGNITLGGPLDLLLKVITVQKQGAQSMNNNPTLPQGDGSIPQSRADHYSN
jgi:type VI secretion system secreted protein VgrG